MIPREAYKAIEQIVGSRYISQEPEVCRAYTLKDRGFEQCLLLYPLNEWQEVETQLSQLSSIRSRDRDFVRSITRHAIPVQFDGQGRIQIPEALIIFSGIQKDVNVIGMIKKIE